MLGAALLALLAVCGVTHQATVPSALANSTAETGANISSSNSSETSFFPPFMSKLTEKLKAEFVSIVNDTELSAAQIDESIAEWGRKNGIEASFANEKVRKFDEERRRFQNETLGKLEDAVNQLPSAFEKVRALLTSDELSGRAIKERLESFVKSLTPEVQSMLDHVMGPAAQVIAENTTTTEAPK